MKKEKTHLRTHSVCLIDRDRDWLMRNQSQISNQLRHDLALLRMLIDSAKEHPDTRISEAIGIFEKIYMLTH